MKKGSKFAGKVSLVKEEHATKFGAWLKCSKYTPRSFSGLIGVSHTTIVRWAKGICTPPVVLIKPIEKLTGGEIKFEDWL